MKNEFIELCEHIFTARQAISPIFGRPKSEKVPVRAVNSLVCKTILSCCGGKVFKSTLMPMFVRRYHEAFLEFDWPKPSQLHSKPLGKEFRRKDWP